MGAGSKERRKECGIAIIHIGKQQRKLFLLGDMSCMIICVGKRSRNILLSPQFVPIDRASNIAQHGTSHLFQVFCWHMALYKFLQNGGYVVNTLILHPILGRLTVVNTKCYFRFLLPERDLFTGKNTCSQQPLGIVHMLLIPCIPYFVQMDSEILSVLIHHAGNAAQIAKQHIVAGILMHQSQLVLFVALVKRRKIILSLLERIALAGEELLQPAQFPAAHGINDSAVREVLQEGSQSTLKFLGVLQNRMVGILLRIESIFVRYGRCAKSGQQAVQKGLFLAGGILIGLHQRSTARNERKPIVGIQQLLDHIQSSHTAFFALSVVDQARNCFIQRVIRLFHQPADDALTCVCIFVTQKFFKFNIVICCQQRFIEQIDCNSTGQICFITDTGQHHLTLLWRTHACIAGFK